QESAKVAIVQRSFVWTKLASARSGITFTKDRPELSLTLFPALEIQ
uniref:Uncharacterized protein n=1 Tax=Anopheles atroparvus TaxID=41427 RepID=A0AAG5DAZ1_ANOAO